MVRKLILVALALPAFASLPSLAADDVRRDATSRTAGESIDDATLTTKVKSAFVKDDQVSALDVKVNTYNGVVQLSGFVDSQAKLERAEQIAKSVGGVKDVKNDLEIRR